MKQPYCKLRRDQKNVGGWWRSEWPADQDVPDHHLASQVQSGDGKTPVPWRYPGRRRSWDLAPGGTLGSHPGPQPLPKSRSPAVDWLDQACFRHRELPHVQFSSLDARLPTTVFFQKPSAKRTPAKQWPGPAMHTAWRQIRTAMPSSLGLMVCSSLFRLFLFLGLHFAVPLSLSSNNRQSAFPLLLHAPSASKSRHKLQVDPFCFARPPRCVCSACPRRSLPLRCLLSSVLQNACLWLPIDKTTSSWADSTLSGRGRATR